MFHRVKPEIQPDAQTPQETPVEYVKVEATEIEETKEVEQVAQPQEETPTQEKETEIMSEEKTTEEVSAAQEAQTATAPASVNPYQRPGTAPAQSYTTSYTPASAYSAPAVSETVAQTGDRRLTIGAGITMSGEIESCDYLLVEGTVEAALKGASMLEISESGTFYGTVEIGEATVAGRFEGDITVTGRLLVRAGGVITGTIAYGELEVESGAVIDGRLTPVAAAQSAAQQQPAAAPVKPAAPVSKPVATEAQPEPANTEEGELFSKAAS